jgi:anti-anti-sigma factor
MPLPAHPDGLETATLPDATVVRLAGPALREANCSGLADLGDRDVFLDCGHVEYVTAAGLGFLVRLHTRLAAAGRHLCLFGVSAAVYEALAVTRLTRLLEVRSPPVRRILLVEDEATTREALKMVLEEEGYRVRCAGDGQEALEQLRHEDRPDLILLDLGLPVMTGSDFRRQQRQDPALAAIPVVVLSGRAIEAQQAAGLDAAGYIEKPVSMDALLETIRRCC